MANCLVKWAGARSRSGNCATLGRAGARRCDWRTVARGQGRRSTHDAQADSAGAIPRRACGRCAVTEVDGAHRGPRPRFVGAIFLATFGARGRRHQRRRQSWRSASPSAWFVRRRFRAWRYQERHEDLLVARGVMVQRLSVVPYGRMQFVEVTAGPIERLFQLSTVKLHTAAAASDARIPGLEPDEAARLRDRLTELGESMAAGM